MVIEGSDGFHKNERQSATTTHRITYNAKND